MTTSQQQPYQLTDNAYPFVPSTAEHNRLEEQCAALNELVLDKPIRAPLKNPQKILDIGCGTGFQTDLLAKMYPNATIIGLDMSPVPDLRPKRDNIIYILGEFKELMEKGHELLQPGTFDLVYQRMLLMGVTSWPRHLESVKSLLKPGGFFESQEMDFWKMYDRENNLISQDWHFLDVATRGPAEQGLNLKIAEALPGHLDEAGYDSVQQEKFPMAFQKGWKKRPETEKLAVYLNWACRPWWRRFFEKGRGKGRMRRL
ncbi:hypothetical protein MRB53_041118 [Persea americana]|nr:hypothetical protein MRB53_041118 [Persea americana]